LGLDSADEGAILLEAIEFCATHARHFTAERLPRVRKQSGVSRRSIEGLLKLCGPLAVSVLSFLRPFIGLLRAGLPLSRGKLAVGAFSELQNRSAEFDDEVITIVNGHRDRPSIRALILRGLSEVRLWKAVDGRVSFGEVSFENLFQADGLPRTFPGPAVAFAIRARPRSDFFGLVGTAQVCFAELCPQRLRQDFVGGGLRTIARTTASAFVGFGGDWAEFDDSIMRAVLGLLSRPRGMPDPQRPVCEFLLRTPHTRQFDGAFRCIP
jgi:hypothetical protein